MSLMHSQVRTVSKQLRANRDHDPALGAGLVEVQPAVAAEGGEQAQARHRGQLWLPVRERLRMAVASDAIPLDVPIEPTRVGAFRT